jgi:hypothetical protein
MSPRIAVQWMISSARMDTTFPQTDKAPLLPQSLRELTPTAEAHTAHSPEL